MVYVFIPCYINTNTHDTYILCLPLRVISSTISKDKLSLFV